MKHFERGFLLAIVFVFWSVPAHAAKFSETAWKEIAPIYEAIRQHPFNQQMVKGTLCKEAFEFYSAQDALYLTDFAKALSVLATKVDSSTHAAELMQSAMDCLVFEKEMHDKNLKGAKPAELAPAAFMYTNFLLATAAYKSREELAAALLPCFWIYLRLGQEMKPKTLPANPYREWILSYSNAKYQSSVEAMIRLTDELAEKATPAQRKKMLAAFVTASRLEWYFWDAAMRLEGWKP